MSFVVRSRNLSASLSRASISAKPLFGVRRRFIHDPARPQAYLEDAGNGIASLVLNRPKAKNAISVKLLKEFQECISIASRDTGVRVLVIRSSEPGSFCAGADLAERRTMTQAEVDTFLTDLRGAFSSLEHFRMPTISAIDGPALGGGLELALSTDLRVAGASVTKIGLPETKLGIIPGAGGTQRATRLLGPAKAKDLIFTGRTMTAHEALAFGLVDYVSEEGASAFDRALHLAQQMATSAPLALRAAKMAISRAHEVPLEVGLDFERACYAPLLKSRDRDEALEAFREKRAPVFIGQ